MAQAAPINARSGFRPDVQGLRAIAVSMVLVYHLFPSALPGGYVGVDVFFVISGFLITGHLLRTLQRTGRVGVVEFYGRRARRLMPAAALVLTVTWVGSRLVLPTTQLPATADQVRASALYFQNWVLAHNAVSYLKSDEAPSPVQHFWSLSVEEQFYLLWPLLFVIAGLTAVLVARRVRARRGTVPEEWRAVTGRRVMLGLALTLLAVSLWYSISDTRSDPAAAYFVTTTRLWELGSGGALALLSERLTSRIGRVGLLAWAGLAMVVVSAFVLTGTSSFPGSIALLPVGGAVLLIGCGSTAARLGTSWLTSIRPMVFLGDISYSLYLWHWPVIVLWKAESGDSIGLLGGVVIAVVSILLAWATKVFVEDRVRLAGFFARHKWRSLATVSAAVVPVALVSIYIAAEPPPFSGKLDANHPGAAVLAGDARTPPHVAAVPPLATAGTDYAVASNLRCLGSQTTATPTECVFGQQTHPQLTVALVGDSVAAQWSTALAEIATRQHWRLVDLTKSACPWTATLTQLPYRTTPYTVCQQWGVTVMHDLLTRIKPDFVITSDRPESGTPANLAPGAAAYLEIATGMTTYWRELLNHGIKVIALRESPEMGQDIPDCLSSHGATVASCSVPTAKAVIAGSPVVLAAKALDPRVNVIDMNSLICGPTTCRPIVGNVIVYRDEHHLTETYTKSLEPYLERKLARAMAGSTAADVPSPEPS